MSLSLSRLKHAILGILSLCAAVNAFAAEEYVLVKSLDEITDGEYIIVKNTTGFRKAMSTSAVTASNITGFGVTTVTVQDDKVATIPAGTAVLTIKHTDNGEFTVQMPDGKYLYTKSTNLLSTADPVHAVITMTSSGSVSINPQSLTGGAGFAIAWAEKAKSTTSSTKVEIFHAAVNGGTTPSLFKKQASMSAPLFDPPTGTAITAGGTVRIECEGAAGIKYIINGSEPQDYDASAGIVLKENATIEAWGIAADGVEGEHATAQYPVLMPRMEFKLLNSDTYTEAGAEIAIVTNGNERYIASGVNADGSLAFSIYNGNEKNFVSYDETEVFVLEQSDEAGRFRFKRAFDNSYLSVDENGMASFADVSSAALFTVGYTSGGAGLATIECEYGTLYFDTSAVSLMCSAGQSSNLQLFRLVGDDTPPVPEELYLYGTFGTGDWNLDLPYRPSLADEGCIDFTDVWIPARCAGHFMFSTYLRPASENSSAATGGDIEWGVIDRGMIFAPALADKELETEREYEMCVYHPGHFGDSRPPYYRIPKNAEYAMHLDFNAYAPTLKVMHTGDIQTGVEDITTQDYITEYYTLQGLRVSNPSKGIYICRKGNEVKKVVIK